eukprot:508643_1
MPVSASRAFSIGLFACIYATAKWSDSTEIRYIAMILSVILLLVTMAFKWWKKNKHKISSAPLSIRGPKPTDSKAGNLPQLAKSGSVHEYIKSLTRIYGPIGAFYWGKQRIAYISSLSVLSDPENKELLRNLDTKPVFLYKGLMPFIGTNSIHFATSTVYNAKSKNIFAKLYSKQNIAQFICDQHTLIQKDINNPWTKRLNTTEPVQIDITSDLFAFATKSVMRCIFGVPVQDMYDNNEVSSTITQMMAHYNKCLNEMEQRLVYGSPPNDNRKRMFAQSMKHVQHGIAKLMDMMSTSSSSISMVNYCKTQKELYANDTWIMDDIITTLHGVHKVYYSLLWTLYFVAKHKNIQSKMMDEISDVLGDVKEREMAMQDVTKLMKLKYCRNVILESLRITSIVSWTARVCHDGELVLNTGKRGKVKIEKNMPIIIALGAMNMDKKDAYTFKPDRYKDGEDVNRNCNVFGGVGDRMCPASNWVEAQTLMFMVSVLSKFELELTSKAKDDIDTIHPKYELLTKPHKTIEFAVSKRQFALL